MGSQPTARPRMAKQSSLSITQQRHVRRHLEHPFCYLCGKGFSSEATDLDHVPPDNMVAVADRANFPLKLKVHRSCHEPLAVEDERMGQLVRATRGELPPDVRDRRGMKLVLLNDGTLAPVVMREDFDIGRVFFRYVRGFHAALYDQFLPVDCDRAVHPPTPEMTIDYRTGNVVAQRERDQQHAFIGGLFRQNLDDDTPMDAIVAYNGHMIYECFWRIDPKGRVECLFSLRIYDLTEMGPVQTTARRGCVGLYRPAKAPPAAAARSAPFRSGILTYYDPYSPVPDSKQTMV